MNGSRINDNRSWNILKDHIILGAGIAGIGAGYKLGENAVLYEKREKYGGLCANFTIDGFRFDYAVHLSFATEDVVRSVFDQTPYIVLKPEAMNYCDGYWVKHPVQNNSYSLPIEERVEIIKSFVNRNNNSEVINYQEWLDFQYGNYFSKKYPSRYTRKYWCCEAVDLTTEWINNRMYQPSIDEVLYGAMTDETPNTYYAKEMRYPEKGGYRAFFEHIAEHMDIQLSHEAIEVDCDEKLVKFSNGVISEYETLISSLPLPEIIRIIKNAPQSVKKAVSRLYATSVALVSVGFKSVTKFPSLWFYVYDENIPFARAYSPSMKSRDNVPNGKSSLQFEIYYTEKNPITLSDKQLEFKVIESLDKLKIAKEVDIEVIDTRHVKYGNVVFYHGMEDDRKVVLEFLESKKIKSIGRFGEWDYLWSNQSFMSGYNSI
jgi:protoporphyrinogen oxidase